MTLKTTYPHRTIENIIQNIDARIKEVELGRAIDFAIKYIKTHTNK